MEAPMAAFFTGLEATLICSFVAFVAGVLFSQKVKDWLAGIPSDLRADLKKVEQVVFAKVKTAQIGVVSELKSAVGIQPPAPPAPPPAPVVLVPVPVDPSKPTA